MNINKHPTEIQNGKWLHRFSIRTYSEHLALIFNVIIRVLSCRLQCRVPVSRFYFCLRSLIKLEGCFKGDILDMEQFKENVLYEYLGTEYRWRFSKSRNILKMRLCVNRSFLTHVFSYISSEIEILLSSFLYHTTTVKLIFHTSLISLPIGHRIGKARFTISVILRAK